ncbi:hypothetical protein [Wielerella bovis]|uniref:hypothetical protein n=1 Tax=Wielerella bovis TaxID=2917790 RepID=UPI002019DFFF|nr:hypothetical protein [Wielerella bovis]MCG7657454.1 hypothetical protein [Wielerella bovis]MCG7659675.1 hypothetical protein [Wielerella bovis]
MFFVFNTISLILCIQTSIVFGVALRRSAFKMNIKDMRNIVLWFIKVLILLLIGVLAWILVSVVMDWAFETNIETISSWYIMFAFPLCALCFTCLAMRWLPIFRQPERVKS